jgi:putative photosynthetic complex assembly protein 2
MTIASPWLGVGITVFAWWVSTGLILLLVRLPRAWHMSMLLGFGVVALAGLWGVIVSADDPTPLGVYCGFFCALLIWGWHEASFLMGVITGPRPEACPPEAHGWTRFRFAAATLIYHEIALFVTLIVIAAVTWQSTNPVAFWTFALLFAMRLSSKFNIFLGVPNLTEEFFPDHLAHLKSYLPKRTMNGLMPFSILACAALGLYIWQQIMLEPSQSGKALALIMLLTLTGLGLLEHVFMITPLPDAALWRWAAPVRPSHEPALKTPSKLGDTELKNRNNG